MSKALRTPMNFKQIACLAAVMLFATIPTAYGAGKVLPVADYLQSQGILTKDSAEKSSTLNQPLNRAKGLEMIFNALELQKEIQSTAAGSTAVFKDVSKETLPYVQYAADHGITSGTGSQRFSPEAPLNRQQFLIWLQLSLALEKVPYDTQKKAALDTWINQKLQATDPSQPFYLGDAANHLASLRFQLHPDPGIQIKYWMKDDVADKPELKKFQNEIKAIFDTVRKKYPLQYKMTGLYVEELNTGYSWSYGDELYRDPATGQTKGKFVSASSIKFPMALAVLNHLEKKKLKLSDTFKDALSGKSYSFQGLLKPMISQSTNNSFNVLLRYMTREKVNGFMADLGAKDSAIYRELDGGDPYWSKARIDKVYGTTTASRFKPSDYGILLGHFYKKVQAKNANALYLNKIMMNTVHETRIPAGIKNKYPVAHKTGSYTDGGIYSDVGIVYLPDNPYALAIILDTQTQHKHCEPFMRELAGKINAYMEGRR